MTRKTIKKIFFWIVLITVVLGFLTLMLPVDQIILGFSAKNDVYSTTTEPKLQGIVHLVLVPIVYCIVWNLGYKFINSRMSPEKRQKSLKILNAFLYLSPLGAVALILNWIMYFF